MNLVLDASAAIDIARGKMGEQGISALERANVIIAPDLFFSEVANAVWKYHRFEKLSLEECLKLKQRCFSMVDKSISAGDVIDEAFLLAVQFQHSVYDACYMVCARRFNASLLSSDQKLLRISEQLTIPVFR